MVSKSVSNEHPCLIFDLKGNTFSFSLLSKMFAVGLSYMVYTMLRYPTSESFYLKWVLSFAEKNFLHLLRWSYGFILRFVDVVHHIFLQILKNPCILGINPTRSWCMSLLIHCWIRIASIMLRILHLCSSAILACDFMEFFGGPMVRI